MFKKSCGTKVLSKLKVIMISISSSNILRSFQKVPTRKIMSKCWKHNNIVTTCVCSFYWETVLKHPPSYHSVRAALLKIKSTTYKLFFGIFLTTVLL